MSTWRATGKQLKSEVMKQKCRLFYLLRGTRKVGDASKIARRSKVDFVTPSQVIIENENKFQVLMDEMDAIPKHGEERDRAIKTFCDKIETTNGGMTERPFTEDRTNLKRKLLRGVNVTKSARPYVRRGSLPSFFTEMKDAEQNTTTAEAQTSCEVNCKEDGTPLNTETVGLFVPDRKQINRIVKNRRIFRAHSKLLFYLRCKYHLAHRDHTFINKLVTEARIWMTKNGFQCDKPEDYSILSSAVLAAFLVSSEELEFRQAIKNRTNHGNMIHLNETVRGELGRTLIPLMRGGHIGGGLLSTNSLKPPKSVV